jgi:hypothetical protein
MLPNQLTVADIATAMGMDEDSLWYLSRHLHRWYKPTRTILVRSKAREIDPP